MRKSEIMHNLCFCTGCLVGEICPAKHLSNAMRSRKVVGRTTCWQERMARVRCKQWRSRTRPVTWLFGESTARTLVRAGAVLQSLLKPSHGWPRMAMFKMRSVQLSSFQWADDFASGEHVYRTLGRPQRRNRRRKSSRIGWWSLFALTESLTVKQTSYLNKTEVWHETHFRKVHDAVLEHWWLSYMEILHRLQLFTQGNEVNKFSVFIIEFSCIKLQWMGLRLQFHRK